MDNKEKTLEFMKILSIILSVESGAPPDLFWNEKDTTYYSMLPDGVFNNFYTKLKKEIFRDERFFEGLQRTALLPCFFHIVCRKCRYAKNHGGIFSRCSREMGILGQILYTLGKSLDSNFSRKKYQEIINYLEAIKGKK